MFLKIGREKEQESLKVRDVSVFSKDTIEQLVHIFRDWRDMQRADFQLRAPVFFREFEQINKRFILIEIRNPRGDELRMLLPSELIISLSEFLDVAAEAVVGKLEGVQRLVVLFLENGERTVKILKVCLRK